jgi:hypothetical protein
MNALKKSKRQTQFSMLRNSSHPDELSMDSPKPSIGSYLSRNEFDTSSPNSVLKVSGELYAPSRLKRVTFSSDVVLKTAPTSQRLQKICLKDLDHGVSMCRAASIPDPDNFPISTTKPKSLKSTELLKRRLHKIEREYVEAAFEVEVGSNDVRELVSENEQLRSILIQEKMTQLGCIKLQNAIEEIEGRIRRYSLKTSKLKKEIKFYNSESTKLLNHLQPLNTSMNEISENQETSSTKSNHER